MPSWNTPPGRWGGYFLFGLGEHKFPPTLGGLAKWGGGGGDKIFDAFFFCGGVVQKTKFV